MFLTLAGHLHRKENFMYTDIESIIENATMKKYFNNEGKFTAYIIEPFPDFMLHINSRDEIVFDPQTNMPTGEVIKGYTKGEVRVCADYDFNENPLGIYAVGAEVGEEEV